MFKVISRICVTLLIMGSLAACNEVTRISLTSDSGDYIGAGKSYSYNNSDALITVTADGGLLEVHIDGDERWSGNFQLPDGYDDIQPGSYGELTRYPFHDPTVGGLSWSGEGRGCNTLDGWFIVEFANYNEQGELQSVKLNFEQHCEGQVAALKGDITWHANDVTLPAGPIDPAPEGLWEPDPDAAPIEGNAVYLSSGMDDFVGLGSNYLYADGVEPLSVTEKDGLITVRIDGWSGDFKPMDFLDPMEPGYYGDLMRYPFNNPVKGGLSWTGKGRGCNRSNGWFVVDSIQYEAEVLTQVEIRFEQYCDSSTAPLAGYIRWSAP